MKRENTHTHES